MAVKTTTSNITQLICAVDVINAITFSSAVNANGYPFYVLKNLSSGTMYISYRNDFTVTDDGVYILDTGESIVIAGQTDTIYIRTTAQGTISAIATSEAVNPFKSVSGGGESGGLTEQEVENIVDSAITSATAGIVTSANSAYDAYSTIQGISDTFTINVANKSSINTSITVGDTNAKTIAVSNVPTRTAILIDLIYTSAGAITWMSGITWETGAVPVFTAGEFYYISLVTSNAGTAWRGMVRGGF
jgi:hypothetical protein